MPTYIELKTISGNRTALQNAGCATFVTSWYRTSSVYDDDMSRRCVLNFGSGTDYYIRCIREVTPPAVPPVITINQALADAYEAKAARLNYFPPFNYDGGVIITNGTDRNGVSSTATLNAPYTIEVSKTQPAGTYVYNTSAAVNYCKGLGTGWRLPTMIESYVMYKKKAKLEAISDFSALTSSWYWSSSVCNGNTDKRCDFHFGNGNFSSSGTNVREAIRCVRDI